MYLGGPNKMIKKLFEWLYVNFRLTKRMEFNRVTSQQAIQTIELFEGYSFTLYSNFYIFSRMVMFSMYITQPALQKTPCSSPAHGFAQAPVDRIHLGHFASCRPCNCGFHPTTGGGDGPPKDHQFRWFRWLSTTWDGAKTL